eukprot:scaffold13772_cov96-Isochrysis_galbana.AAC.4
MCEHHGARLRGVIINKVLPEKLGMVKDYFGRVCEQRCAPPGPPNRAGAKYRKTWVDGWGAPTPRAPNMPEVGGLGGWRRRGVANAILAGSKHRIGGVRVRGRRWCVCGCV